MSKEFNEIELQSGGKIYDTYGEYGGAPYSEIEYLNQPITPKENFKRFFEGKDYYWIPDCFSDIVEITPDINPDTIATGYSGGIDSFGVTWVPVDNGMPAMVMPGDPFLDDIEDWETLTFPDVNSWDWEESGKKYIETFDHERPFRGCLPNSTFERMIDVLEFEEAAMSLLTSPDEVGAFLEKVTDYNIAILDNFVKYHKVDAITICDDWATQRNAFFSSETARNVLLPHIKRVVERAHELGLEITLHSCGNGINHIPLFIEAGLDAWQFQENAVDIQEALKLCGDKLKLEGYWIVPEGYSEDQTEEFIYNIMDKYCRNGQMLVSFCDSDYMVNSFIRKKVYEIGRKIVSEMNV